VVAAVVVAVAVVVVPGIEIEPAKTRGESTMLFMTAPGRGRPRLVGGCSRTGFQAAWVLRRRLALPKMKICFCSAH